MNVLRQRKFLDDLGLDSVGANWPKLGELVYTHADNISLCLTVT